MGHYPSHKREAFLRFIDQWREAGEPPETATMEVDYQPREFPVGEFLEMFRACEDMLPGEYREAVAELHDDEGEVDERARSFAGTYGAAAFLLTGRLLDYSPSTFSIEDMIAAELRTAAGSVEQARAEVKRASRNRKRVWSYYRNLAEQSPDALCERADALAAGNLTLRRDEVQVITAYTVLDGEGREVGFLKASVVDPPSWDDVDEEAASCEGIYIDRMEWYPAAGVAPAEAQAA